MRFFPEGTHKDMDRYLYDPLVSSARNGGKRHRPLVTMLACQAVGGTAEQALTAAAAIELFHTAALIHDDIADEGELRRGEPCMYLTEGVGLAINAGDLALSLVTGTIIDDPLLPDAVKIRAVKEVIDMTTRTVEGQALDIGWARDGRFDVTIEDYLAMATHKTAYYSGGVPLAVGAIIGGASEEQIEAMREFGMACGLAFQLQDDLLNLIGTEEATKKDFRNDITEGKRTMIVVHALEHTQGAAHEELLGILQAKTTDEAQLARAVELMDAAGSIEFVRAYAKNVCQDSKPRLLEVLPESPQRELLLGMADFFISRIN